MADGEGYKLYPSPVSSESRNEGGVFLCIFLDLYVAAEVPTEADFYDDEGSLFPIKRCRVWGGSVLDFSCVIEVRRCAMSGLEQRLGLYEGENPIWYAAGYRGALCVPGGGGDTLVSVVLGDIGVAPTADLLRRGQGCKPTVGRGLLGRGEVGVLRGGGE